MSPATNKRQFFLELTCKRKVRYTGFMKAMNRFIEIGTNPKSNYGATLHVYLCEVCQGYHLGNRGRKSRAAKQAKGYNRKVTTVIPMLIHQIKTGQNQND